MVYLRDYDVTHFDAEGKVTIHQCLPNQSAEVKGKDQDARHVGCTNSSSDSRNLGQVISYWESKSVQFVMCSIVLMANQNFGKEIFGKLTIINHCIPFLWTKQKPMVHLFIPQPPTATATGLWRR